MKREANPPEPEPTSNPVTVEAALAAAIRHLQAGRIERAEDIYRKILEAQPSQAVALHYLGVIALQGDDNEAAVDLLASAVAVEPGYARAHNNLGTALMNLGRHEEAAASYQRAIALDSGYAVAYTNLGNALKNLGGYAEGIAAHRKCVALDPDFAEGHWNLAVALLLGGHFEEGWSEYEWRWMTQQFAGRKRDFSEPPWDGSDLGGKTVLIWGEQGIGDEIMFAGLIPEVAAAGGHCVLACDRRLVPLFARSFPDVEVVPKSRLRDRRSGSLEFDVQTPIGSLARLLRPGLGGIGRPGGYLRPDARRSAESRARYESRQGTLIVGISWHSVNTMDGGSRTVPLESWGALLSQPGVRFVNLQYGDCAADLAGIRARMGVDVHDDETIDPLKNLDDFAAQVAAMDLVISIANSTVHMAGAVGVPVWTMVPRVPDWRWLLGREDSPWYPSMRLFRQETWGDWGQVIERVRDALAAFRRRDR